MGVIGNKLMGKFVKDLIIHILAMISEQERAERKRRQALKAPLKLNLKIQP